ncbi:MAG: TetR/AcrR family transcriptional regulator, partial [Alphaproteobacteria bacterium]|nr:TetR/AcrR family transcriptional regulator [Alphaproteobacteria bacterium]
MPRPKSFDPDQALTEAMALFWAKGYGATSISDLETHLQLGRISLYSAFGSKKQLFLRCLEKYRRDITAPLLQKLDDKDGLRGIRNFFATVLTSPPDIRRRGCLIVNTMVAAEEPDHSVDAVIQDHVLRVEQCFLRAIRAGQKAGTIGRHIKPRGAARLLVTLAHGAFALHRVGVDPALTKTAV